MMDESPRKVIHDAIQDTAHTNEDLDGGVLVAWVLVGEWMDGEGKKWLSMLEGSDGGESDLTMWQRQGFLHNALYDDNLFEHDEREDD